MCYLYNSYLRAFQASKMSLTGKMEQDIFSNFATEMSMYNRF